MSIAAHVVALVSSPVLDLVVFFIEVKVTVEAHIYSFHYDPILFSFSSKFANILKLVCILQSLLDLHEPLESIVLFCVNGILLYIAF